jgi:1,2-dihydroxy-3-keto-5-methylthiopentene dioxygenase
VICCRGDLMSVPTGVKHWFDMGPNPSFTVIRIFTDPAGWVAQFTGDKIAALQPAYGETVGA